MIRIYQAYKLVSNFVLMRDTTFLAVFDADRWEFFLLEPLFKMNDDQNKPAPCFLIYKLDNSSDRTMMINHCHFQMPPPRLGPSRMPSNVPVVGPDID